MRSPRERNAPKKGDIILVAFPFTDQTGEKVRPALVIGASTDHVITLFITSRAAGNAWLVPVEPTGQTGLEITSFIRCDKIASFDIRIVKGVVGSAPRTVVKEVDVLLKKILRL